jgi:hypothetical protein
MNNKYRVVLGYCVLEQRQVREGNAMLLQFRSVVHNPDGSIETPEWITSGRIDNYGDVFDKKLSLWQCFCNWCMGSSI